METSIINSTVDGLLDYLGALLITNVDPVGAEKTIPFTVKEGRLQSDPTPGTGLSIMVFANSPYTEDWHELAKSGDHGITFPQWEVGGGNRLWRKYMIEIGMFNLYASTKPISRHNAYIVLARLEHALWNFPCGQLPADSFGEHAILPVVTKSRLSEGGGNTAFIWRGYVHLQTLNSR